ncbi:hypothetical protein [Pseudarthrobacter sp. PS3-L1]|uniref:hypothetical protein n=1 Tax=Pseudarthrobacter sp. PS3-L1 TaxID=3046207 RepID=UPI0024BB6B28|nr:hypothetical protein [Pseudarthrobacter sp. PS3-L1]MDJ0320251.1 hypothetical protein [Pseudarthrobacter sp. PS3-L1]
MEPLLNFLGHYWWLVFVFSGMAGGWATSWRKSTERRHQRRLEILAAKNQSFERLQHAEADLDGIKKTHDGVERRWLDYELDVGKMIDFPMMSDVREPLTVAFLRAKREAEGLRPPPGGDPLPVARCEAYRAAVNSFDVAFGIAEREARRIKDGRFTGPERDRLATARKLLRLAEDTAATPAERQSAYRRVRRELDGLIDLPDAAVAALETRMAPMLDSGHQESPKP